MDLTQLASQLQRVASELRSTCRSSFFPLLPLAERIDVAVSLELIRLKSRSHAISDLGVNPVEVKIQRKNHVVGTRKLSKHEDRLLTPPERFSLAHELGHIVAFKEFGVRPETERKAYWEQELIMNDFARSLLIPDWLVTDWVERSKKERPIPPHALKTWGIDQCGVSQQVVALALANACSDLGFMTATICESKKFRKKALKVLFSASGENLRLPAAQSHILLPEIQEGLVKKVVGGCEIRNSSLVANDSLRLHSAWRRAQSKASYPVYWLSFATSRKDEYEYERTPQLRFPGYSMY
jgi:hypothetical protein